MLLHDLIHDLDGIAPLPPGAPNPRICDITEDARTAMPGSLFVARKGLVHDGHDHIAEALEAGAIAVLTDRDDLALPPPGHHRPVPVVLRTQSTPLASARLAERFYGDPSKQLTLIAVTGTNGKTTVTYLIHQLLNNLGIPAGLVGTIWIDDGTEVAPATHTTPPALELSRTLSRMVEAGCRAAVIEASSHALVQSRIDALDLDVAVFTNLSPEHLDYHGSLDAYADAKARLFDMLPATGVAVVNDDDPTTPRMLRDCKARVLRCTTRDAGPKDVGTGTTDADACAHIRSLSVAGSDYDLRIADRTARVRSPLVGRFNVTNAMLASAAVHAAARLCAIAPGSHAEPPPQTGLERIASLLGTALPPPGRLEPVTDPPHEQMRHGQTPLTVLVDYAHTDDALKHTLETIRDLRDSPDQNIWCVFGCGGDRDRTKRPRMGAVVARIADHAVVTSDNPRTEPPNKIIDDILEGVPEHDRAQLHVEPDRERAIRHTIRSASPNDIVVIAGKGHETYQILPDPSSPTGTVTRDFDDRAVARSQLRLRGITPRTAHDPVKSAVLHRELLDAGNNADDDTLDTLDDARTNPTAHA